MKTTSTDNLPTISDWVKTFEQLGKDAQEASEAAPTRNLTEWHDGRASAYLAAAKAMKDELGRSEGMVIVTYINGPASVNPGVTGTFTAPASTILKGIVQTRLQLIENAKQDGVDVINFNDLFTITKAEVVSAVHVPQKRQAESCECYYDCRDCSRSGSWHVHAGEPCPIHPDAPGDH